MTKPLKYISRIRDDFDTVICGINGVFSDGMTVDKDAVDVLIKMYQSGKKIALSSNSGLRARDMFLFLKKNDVPMNIFYAIITAGEIAHFYLKKHAEIGSTYYPLVENENGAVSGLDLQAVDSVVLADFAIAEMTQDGVDVKSYMPMLEQMLNLQLPLICVGNNTQQVKGAEVVESVGALAEQYAMMGGKILSFGKPDVRIASYLTESIADFNAGRCLVIGDGMATDMRMGNNFNAQTLLISGGIHQFDEKDIRQMDELSKSYGLNVDYCMEKLRW